MRPKTSVRQPIIASVRHQRLSELLRTWRRQPRKRSPLLFWTLLALALVCDSGFLFVGIRLLGNSSRPTAPLAERHIYVPYAADADLWEPLRHWVIRANGRTQLFDSFCRRLVRDITGDERFEGHDALAVVVSWWLDGQTNALKWTDYPCLCCEDAELRAVIYREKHSPAHMSRREQLHGRYVEPAVVRSSPGFDEILGGVRVKGENVPLSALERKAVELRDRLARWEQIRQAGIEASNSSEVETASAALRDAYQSETPDLFAAALTDFLKASRPDLEESGVFSEDRCFACEAWLNKYQPASKASFLCACALALFVAGALLKTRRPRWRRGLLRSGFVACLGCLGCALAAFLCGAIRDGTPVGDGAQGILGSATVILALSLLLALPARDAFLALTGTLLAGAGFVLANLWPLGFALHWPSVPDGAADPWLRLQVLLLVSAYATLTLAWTLASFTLARILLAAATGERVRGMAGRCVQLLRIGIALLTASAFLDGCRALGQGDAWRGWNVQALGTLLVLPGCLVLLSIRRRGWIQPITFLVGIALGFTFLALVWQAACWMRSDSLNVNTILAVEGWFYAAALVQLGVSAHAALRYYFGRQRILEV